MPHQAYIGADGREWPSVTGVLSVVNKPWLMDWYRRAVIKSGKKGWLANEKKSEEGKKTGSHIHGEIENILRGVGSENPHARAAVHELMKLSPEIEAIEIHMVDTQRQLHGSLDFVARINGELMVGDWKTNVNADKYHAAQLAAYDSMFGGCGKGLLVTIDKKAKTPKAEAKIIQDLPSYMRLFDHMLALWKFEHWGLL